MAKTYAGSYAAQVRFRKVITLSGGAGTFNALASFYLTMQLTADTANQQVNVAAHDCHVDLTGTGTVGLMGATLQIQDNVFGMMTLDSAVFSASTTGGTTSWSMTPIQGPMGWKWSSASDTMPTTSSDSRVFDQDGDGHPGITLHVFWQGTDYPLYVVMTQNESLSGTAASGGALTGTTVDTTSMEHHRQHHRPARSDRLLGAGLEHRGQHGEDCQDPVAAHLHAARGADGDAVPLSVS